MCGQTKVKSTYFPSPSTLLLFCVLFLASAVRIIYLFHVSTYPNFNNFYPGLDAELYHELAKQVADGHLALGNNSYYYSPLYAYFLGAFYFLFNDGPWIARLINLLLGTASVGLIFAYTKTFFRSTTTAVITALGAALYGPYLVFDTSGLKASLGQFLLVSSLFLISRELNRQKPKAWIVIGVFLGLSANVSGMLTPFVAALGLWLLFLHPQTDGNDSTPPTRFEFPKRMMHTTRFLIDYP